MNIVPHVFPPLNSWLRAFPISIPPLNKDISHHAIGLYIVSRKVDPPLKLFAIFSLRLSIFLWSFVILLPVYIYIGLYLPALLLQRVCVLNCACDYTQVPWTKHVRMFFFLRGLFSSFSLCVEGDDYNGCWWYRNSLAWIRISTDPDGSGRLLVGPWRLAWDISLADSLFY